MFKALFASLIHLSGKIWKTGTSAKLICEWTVIHTNKASEHKIHTQIKQAFTPDVNTSNGSEAITGK